MDPLDGQIYQAHKEGMPGEADRLLDQRLGQSPASADPCCATQDARTVEPCPSRIKQIAIGVGMAAIPAGEWWHRITGRWTDHACVGTHRAARMFSVESRDGWAYRFCSVCDGPNNLRILRRDPTT